MPSLNLAIVSQGTGKSATGGASAFGKPNIGVNSNKIQIVQKQIVYARADSVKSNATNASQYPKPNGNAKVVKLIRGENNDIFADTTRSQAIHSAIKGASGTG
jgi:hypothetical protein